MSIELFTKFVKFPNFLIDSALKQPTKKSKDRKSLLSFCYDSLRVVNLKSERLTKAPLGIFRQPLV